MNKLISRNPVQRFKQGRKIIFAQEGNKTYYEVTEKPKIPITKAKEELRNGYMRINNNGKWAWGKYDSNGNFVPITKEVVLDDGTILNINGTRSTVSARNAAKNPKVIERGYIDSNGNKTPLSTSTNNVNKKTKTGKIPSNKTEYDNFLYAGKMGGWNRSMGNSISDQGSIDILKKLGWWNEKDSTQNNAERIQKLLNSYDIGGNRVVEDNKWGNQSRAALQNYYNRWLKEQKPVEQKPTIPLPEAPVAPTLQRQAISDYSNYAQNLKQALGGNSNFSGLSNLVWKEYADDDNSFAANFSRDMRTRFKDYGTQQSWLDNQAAIEKALNIFGRYRGTRTGDYRDIANSMSNWAGEYNYNIDKQNQALTNDYNKKLDYYNTIIDKYKRTVGGYKMGGLLPSRNVIERFKQGRKINLLEEGGISKKRTTPRKRFVLAASDNSFSREFDTEEEAKAYRKAHKIVGVIRDQKNASNGSVIKGSRVQGKDTETTAYDRQQAEKYNNLSMKEAYKVAQKSGNKYFAYKGKVYKTDLKNGKDNMTEMMKMYGNSLGWDKDPKLNTKKSMEAREQYRKSVDAKKGNRNANYHGKTNSQANAKADKNFDKELGLSTLPVQFTDAMAPLGNLQNLALTLVDSNYKPEITRSGLNPFGYAYDAIKGNVGGLGTRALDLTAHFGLPGARTLMVKAAPKIPVPTYLQKLYHGDTSSTNWVINGLNRAQGKVKNFFTRIVPTKGNGHFGTYSVEASEHISPSVTSVINNGANQYITGNPSAVQPLYTKVANTVVDPRSWHIADWINDYSNNNY